MPTNMRLQALIVAVSGARRAGVAAAKKPKTRTAAAARRGAGRAGTRHHGRRHHRIPPRRTACACCCSPIRSKQTITVNITYLVGSRHENYGETGMAHLLEHLVFKGIAAPSRTSRTSCPRTARAPTAPRPGTAPTTSRRSPPPRRTCAGRSISKPTAWSIPSSRKKDLDSEMTVVRNEFEMGENNPIGVLFKRMLSVAYDWHNYGNTPIGARSDIEGVPIERLQAFYRTYYQPDNAMLLVAGKFDEAATLAHGQRIFRRHPAAHARACRDCTPSSRRRMASASVDAAPRRRRAGGRRRLSHAVRRRTKTSPRCRSSAQVLGDAPAGRLHKALVETGKAAAVFPASLQLHDAGMFGFAAQVRDGQPVDAGARACSSRHVEKPAAKPITDEEVERARTQILKQIELSLNNSEDVGLS